jgi:ElaB/YqjD/DUF883 family membrane-anchored ribosome-binding protein
LASKQNQEEMNWEDAVQQLREDLDEKLDLIQRKLSKSAQREKVIEDETEGLRYKFGRIGSRARDGVDRADDLVREHPVVIVGGVLAFGLLMGALLSRRTED